MPFRCAGEFTSNDEPTLDAILAEPIVRMRMASDHVDESDGRKLLKEALARRQASGKAQEDRRA